MWTVSHNNYVKFVMLLRPMRLRKKEGDRMTRKQSFHLEQTTAYTFLLAFIFHQYNFLALCGLTLADSQVSVCANGEILTPLWAFSKDFLSWFWCSQHSSVSWLPFWSLLFCARIQAEEGCTQQLCKDEKRLTNGKNAVWHLKIQQTLY